jgi:hypothetical protein
MNAPIRELKRRYKINLALGRALPTNDLAISLPLSTGNPLYDAALTDKLTTTATLSQAEHLNRGWHLARQGAPAELQTLAAHAPSLLNDYKLLLALRAWESGNEDLTRTFLQALPWHWRLAFPTAVLKPAAHFFTGWRKSLKFRLVEEPRYPALRELYHELLAQAPPVALLKYRRTIKEAAALQKFRFEGERERAIHDLCFNNGRAFPNDANLEPITTYIQAREALAGGSLQNFLDVLENAAQEIPLTAYMGLLGNARIGLNDHDQEASGRLRHYAIRSATAVDCLLRLNEWQNWLAPVHVAVLGAKVSQGIIERGLDIPFFKVTKAFMNAPLHVRRMVLEPLYIPLLRHFGRQMAGLLGQPGPPHPGPLTYLQPANAIHIMSFLLYTTLSSAMDTRFFLVFPDGVEETPPLDVEEVARHLADDPQEMESWLLQEFGGLAAQYHYTYDYQRIGQILRELDPQAPLLLDLPFAESMDILDALLPFERVFNLNSAFGAPGEICIAYEYYALLTINAPSWHYGLWSRYSDIAAQRFAEFLHRLRAFQQLAAAA